MNRAIVGRGAEMEIQSGGLRPFPALTHAQLDALAGLAADMGGRSTMDVIQTYTATTGTHLYARKAGGIEYHVSRAGACTRMVND